MSAARRRRPTILLVARREILVRVRSRVFAVTTIGMVAAVVIGISIASHFAGSPPAVQVGFVGGSQALEEGFAANAAYLGATVTVSDVADEATGRGEVTAGTLDALVTGSATSPTVVVKDAAPESIDSAVWLAAEAGRLGQAGLSPSAITSAMVAVPVVSLQPSDPQATQNVIGALATAILLFVSLSAYGNFVSQGVIEEKSTRMMEIMLATVRPSQLLAGKVIGVGLVGFAQMTCVAAAAIVIVALTHFASIPALGLATILSDLLWFVLGFLLYAMGYATFACLVSRQEEAAAAATPITLVLSGAYILMFFALPDPSAPWVEVLSLLPPLSPIFMAIRMATGGVPLWQLALAVTVTVASIAGLTSLAGRIYARAALRTGKRMQLLEALRGG
jgi:ABC-2 type transport system permease protein